MFKEIIILTVLVICCMALPTQKPLQKVMAVVVQPEIVKAPRTEIFATAESGWRNRGHIGYGYGNYGGGWRRGGGYRGGYYGGGWKTKGRYYGK